MTMMTMTIKITSTSTNTNTRKISRTGRKNAGKDIQREIKDRIYITNQKIDCPGFGGKWNEKKNTCEAFPDPESQTDWEDTVCDDPKDTDRYPEVCQPDSKEYAEQQERALKVDLEAREKVLKESEEWQERKKKS